MNNFSLPFSQACENNKQPILTVLKPLFKAGETVLEIGSGTGQHSVYFATNMPDIIWQPSDRAVNIANILAWQQHKPLSNNLAPLLLDLDSNWPSVECQHIFTANTLHIISWLQVESFFQKARELLCSPARLIIYGPFNYNGSYTSESNRQFDAMLTARDPLSGIRDFESVNKLAEQSGFYLYADHEMPANNRCLVFSRL